MTSEGLGEMFEGDSADTRAICFFASVDEGPSGGSEDPGARTPIGASGNFYSLSLRCLVLKTFI